LTFRLLYAGVLGAAVGKERSGKQHHPAGVRTMSLVSLGAAAFSICSLYGFASAGRYDPSRMASSVASGVGFIGAGVITTTGSRECDEDGNGGVSIVHGLTTAAAIWLSAAVGVGCGVGLHYLSTAGALLTISILRIGRWAQRLEETRSRRKRMARQRVYDNDDDEDEDDDEALIFRAQQRAWHRSSHPKVKRKVIYDDDVEEEKDDHPRLFKDEDIHANPLDVYEDESEQFVFRDERPSAGWNETDKMDA
jgi:putative Mg2+ transporter-C (MgtC) family protein